MLNLTGFQPYQDSTTTTIYLSNFVLDVGVPCSGLKLIVAVTAFTVFFVLIGGLRWWANLSMFALIVPLCLFVNGLRIALIGVVGDFYGHDAGMSFHDYSGYITLIVCFVILFKIARGLGWKD
jgi:exosortase/archaeosortase family protein